jgi:integrase
MGQRGTASSARTTTARVLRTLASKLGLAKLNFQVLRRTMATLAQTKGGVKDVQGILGHSKADTTVNVYLQQIEAGVKSTLDAIYSELTAREEVAAGS